MGIVFFCILFHAVIQMVGVMVDLFFLFGWFLYEQYFLCAISHFLLKPFKILDFKI